MAISTPFIRRPIATSLLMAGILMIGAVAYPLLPVAPLPQVDFPTIQVNTQFPGGGPETMASSVTAPLERQFAQIPGVTQMTSSSTLGNSSITVQFDLNRNIDGAAQDIQTAINAAGGQLPKTLPSPPTYRKVNPADAPIFGLAVHSDSLPITVVDDYAENVLVQHISQIPGVAQVNISGQQKPSVRIQVDPEELASMGLGLEDVRAALATVTTDSPKGSIDAATRTFTINANDQLLSAEPWNDVIIAYKKGAPVRVRDIGHAIVVLENIHRYIEEGMNPVEAAIKGSGGVGFTIVSISLSLVAVFIPLLLMGGIVGRVFREFAVTVTMTILLSAFVSLTLTPVMAALFMRRETSVRHGRLYLASERVFDLMQAGYRRSLDVAMRHSLITLVIFMLTVIASGYLFVIIPKGFFPQQDTGLIIGTSETAQDVSFAEMARRQMALAEVVSRDPDVATIGMTAGSSAGQTQNNGRLFITLKPRDQRSASASQIINRLRPQIAKVQDAALFLQPAQDINVGGRPTRTLYQYTLQDADVGELNQWAPKIYAKLKTLPELRDVATDQQTGGATLTLQIDRDQASRFGIQPQLIDDTLNDAFGQRQVTQYFTQLSSYHVIQEVLPELQNSKEALDRIYIKSPVTGQQVRLSTLAKWTNAPTTILSINHQGQFPAITLSFNLAPNVALGQAVQAIKQAETELVMPASLSGSFQGNAQAFQPSLASEPYLVAAALVVIYIILGMLYESYIHPLTILSTLPSAGVAALLMLMMFGFDFSVIALIGVILLIGIVKKNGIMMVDFAIAAQRDRGLSGFDAIREACLLRFRPIMMTTIAALLGRVSLMLGSGTGAELRQPLGYSMVGGLILSQALTL